MEKHTKEYAVVALVLVFAVLGFWYVKSYARSIPPMRTFSVQGEGEVTAIPDIALVSLTILTEGGKDLAALQKENTEKGNRVIAFLKESDIESKDIKTETYQISPRYQNYSCGANIYGVVEPCPPSEIVGYSIYQSIAVKVRDLNKAGSIVSGVVAQGANTVSGPNFTIDEPEKLQNEARAKAMTSAKTRAQILAKAGGFSLGKPVSISEGYTMPYATRFALDAKGEGMGGDMPAPAPSFEPGSEKLTASISVTYEIK